MSIEDRIKQIKFKSNHHKLIVNLIVSHGWVMEVIKNFIASEKITIQQYNILRILRGAAPQPISTLQIRERMLDKMSDTSRIVDRLVIKKLVTKKSNTQDHRLVDVKITAKGMELLARLDGLEQEAAKAMGISEEEALFMSDLLDKMRHDNN